MKTCKSNSLPRSVGFLLHYFIVNEGGRWEGWLTTLCDVLLFRNLYIIFDSATSLSDYFSQFVQALTCDLKVVSSSPSEISTFFFISMRNLIKIYFTYTTKHYEFRFFFRTVTLLCFENGLLPSTLIRQSAPYYNTTLNLKKKCSKNIDTSISVDLEKFSIIETVFYFVRIK